VIFVGYDGQVSIENNQRHTDDDYHLSSSAQLPKWPCYAFEVLDKGWRVEMDIWSEECPGRDFDDSTTSWREEEDNQQLDMVNYRTFIHLDTPIARSRKMRNVAIGKTGDGTIDFLFRELMHSASTRIKAEFVSVCLVSASFI